MSYSHGCRHSHLPLCPLIAFFPKGKLRPCRLIYVRSCSVPRGHPSSKSYPPKFYICRRESVDPSWCSLYYWCGGWTSYDWFILALISVWDFYLEVSSKVLTRFWNFFRSVFIGILRTGDQGLQPLGRQQRLYYKTLQLICSLFFFDWWGCH